MKKFYLLSMLMLLPLMASGYTQIDNLYYDLNADSKTAVVAFSSNNRSLSGDIVIPETVTYKGVIYTVTSIGDSAFDNCYDLVSVTLPNSLTSIGKGAFWNCSGLTSIKIPEGITSIKDKTFYGCSNLTTVILPSTITSIGHWAFADCPALFDVYCYAKDVPSADDEAFMLSYEQAMSATLHLPASSIDAYKWTSPWPFFWKVVAIEDIEDTDEEIEMSSAGQTTYCSENDLDFTNVEGLKAYTATGYNRTTGTIWLTRVYEVPSKTGILLIGNEGVYKVPKKSTTCYYMNMFVGTLKAITIEETNGEYTNYYLSKGDYGVGFYKVDGSKEIKANRAYLPLLRETTQAGTRFIGLEYGDGVEGTTGIETNNREPITNNHWFNLQGQRVDNPGKGLFIRNGKKIMIK